MRGEAAAVSVLVSVYVAPELFRIFQSAELPLREILAGII